MEIKFFAAMDEIPRTTHQEKKVVACPYCGAEMKEADNDNKTD